MVQEHTFVNKGVLMRRELGIARCGLACCLCSENDGCDGCESESCPDAATCEVRSCSTGLGLEFARRFGEGRLLDCLERNEAAGVVYHREGITGEYDDFDDLEELIAFIETGRPVSAP